MTDVTAATQVALLTKLPAPSSPAPQIASGSVMLFFDDSNFGGNRSTIFLSEWNSGTLYSISDWWLQDRISSVRWKTLSDRQTAVLFDNSDGSGDQYNNIKGWGDVKEIASLPDVGFN